MEYCKRGYFREKCCKDISRGGYFHDTTPITSLKHTRLIFALGYFREDAQSAKNVKITPMGKFPRLHYCNCANRLVLYEGHLESNAHSSI